MTEPRVLYRCDGCGQTDDHPKMHYVVQTYHHDCIPAFVMDDLTSETYYTTVDNGQLVMTHRVPLPEESLHPGTQRLLEIRKLALKGMHGEKLLEHIRKLPAIEDITDDGKAK
jgi:hypothetical protein